MSEAILELWKRNGRLINIEHRELVQGLRVTPWVTRRHASVQRGCMSRVQGIEAAGESNNVRWCAGVLAERVDGHVWNVEQAAVGAGNAQNVADGGAEKGLRGVILRAKCDWKQQSPATHTSAALRSAQTHLFHPFRANS